MSDYLDYITDVNEDLNTETVIDLKLKLTCNQIQNLEFKALEAGFKSSSDLIEAFIGDLTGWGVTNGSDERHHAEQWYERAFGIWTAENYYFRTYLFLNNHSYSMEDMVNSINGTDLFDDMYEEYLTEGTGQQCESKEDCLKVLREVVNRKTETIKDIKQKEIGRATEKLFEGYATIFINPTYSISGEIRSFDKEICEMKDLLEWSESLKKQHEQT